jgi:tetratricopeptide (TPR) repeat protein
MNPPPAIPEEAKRLVDRGMAAVQGAGSADDFKDAAAEFAKASLAAPWVANVYSNLGVVQDKVGLYTEAISSLNLYLLAAPNAPDAEATKSLIHQIEYRREKAAGEARAAAAKQAEDERQKRAQQVRNTSFEGRWANLDLIDYRTGLPHPGNDIIIDRDSSGNLRVKQQDGGGGLNQGEGVHLDGNKLTYTLANYISTWRVELALSPDGTNLFKTSTYLGQNEEQRRNAPGLIIDQPVEHHQYRRSE